MATTIGIIYHINNMKKQSNKYIYIILLLGSIILAPNIYRLISLKIEYNNLTNVKNQKSMDTQALQSELEKREHDISYLEKIAYKDFQMIKEGEKIYRIQDNKQVEE